MIAAAPIPITARVQISSPIVPEYAANTEATPNNAIAPMRKRLRPKRSPSSPAGSSRPAKASV